MNCFIFDIDGTLADLSHRLHHVQKSPKDWDAFFAAMGDDALIVHMADVLDAIAEHWTVIYVSGRPEDYRRITETWLANHALPDAPLYMRPSGDYRADDIVKSELLIKIRADGFDPVMAFDDRDRVVKMWRANGIPCAQVAEGDF